MTPKELLYIEDALGHEVQMKNSFQNFSNQLSDPDLKQFVQGVVQKQSANFSKLYALLNQ